MPKRSVSSHSECAPSSSRSEGNANVIPNETSSNDESVYHEGDAVDSASRQEDLPIRRLSDQDARHSLSGMNPTYEFDDFDRHRMQSRGSSWRRRRGGYNPRNYH